MKDILFWFAVLFVGFWVLFYAAAALGRVLGFVQDRRDATAFEAEMAAADRAWLEETKDLTDAERMAIEKDVDEYLRDEGEVEWR